ncbi:hypothetical protein, partial [Klebsiella pneumoniae]|uniref:hypothetical protein n=2 Tax=Klebsiella/Raoultella group TaxID=2890311 RepID=UPI001E53616D
LMMSLWDALRMNMMISYQELVRTFPGFASAPLQTIGRIFIFSKPFPAWRVPGGSFAFSFFVIVIIKNETSF